MPKTDDYQSLNQELEAVLDKLQQPEVKLDDAVKLYDQGLKLVAKLEAQLKQAENKITRLKLQAESGE